MRVIVVGRDQEIIQPLVDQLTNAGFEVTVLENSTAVLSFIKKTSLQFLVAEVTVLVDHRLGPEVLKHCPLARLVAFSSNSSRLKMIDGLSNGLVDYLPRRLEAIPELVKVLVQERVKLLRWRKTLFFVSADSCTETVPEITT